MKLIACSGGPDSMALLDMERKTGGGLFVCHVNYRKRPTADRDEAIVRQYCETHGLLLAVLYPHYEGGNFQAWARDVRYDFFCRQAHLQGIGKILVAHQQDDLLETYVFQRERHMRCDWYGLQYRSRRQDLVIERPLLGWTKAGLEAYCQENGVDFGVDESNLGDDYTRNRIRHGMQERDKARLLTEISRMNREQIRFRKQATRFFDSHAATELLDLPRPTGERLLDAWIAERTGQHLSARQCSQLFADLQKDCVTEFGGWKLERHGRDLLLAEPGWKPDQAVTVRTMEELADLSVVDGSASGETCEPVQRLSVTEADFPLMIRPVKPGDVIHMRFGKKKLSRFFIDRHISRLARGQWYVVENAAGDVIYVPGLGCDRDHFAGGHTFCFRQFSPVAVHDKIKTVTFKENQL